MTASFSVLLASVVVHPVPFTVYCDRQYHRLSIEQALRAESNTIPQVLE